MNSIHKGAINAQFHTVVSNTGNIVALLNLLSEREVFGEPEIQQILSRGTEYDQATQLYKAIIKKDDFTFEILINALRKTGNEAVSSTILKNLKGIKQGSDETHCDGGCNINSAVSGSEKENNTSDTEDDEDDDDFCRKFKSLATTCSSFEFLSQGCGKVAWPLDSLATEEIQPKHLDFTGLGITDKGVLEIVKLINSNKDIHALILSKNEITRLGFIDLLNNLPKTLKYLMVDRNYIHFNPSQFENLFNSESSKWSDLKILDLSYNFVAKKCFDVLNSRFPTEKVKEYDAIKYIRVNACKIIYQRDSDRNCKKEEREFLPVVCHLKNTKVFPDVDFVDENKGCVALVEAKKIPLFAFLRYSTHVKIIIERIHEGQREFFTADFVSYADEVCRVRLISGDPFQTSHENGKEVRSVLQVLGNEYEKPRRGYVDNNAINFLIEDIKNSQEKVGLGKYSILKAFNCYQWAKERLKCIADIPEIEIPITYKLFVLLFVEHCDLVLVMFIALVCAITCYLY